MVRRVIFGIVLSLLLANVLNLQVAVHLAKSYPALIIVPDHYLSIQEAINAAVVGDWIFVRNGTYHESIVVNKTVNLVGEDVETTKIYSEWDHILAQAITTVNITANNVTLTGFSLSANYNMLPWPPDRAYAIVEAHGNYCKIANNYINYSHAGVVLLGDHITFKENEVVECFRGVYLLGRDLNVSHNRFISRSRVVFGYGRSSGVIVGNLIESGAYMAFYLGGDDLNLTIINNTVNHSLIGFQLNNCHGPKIYHNNFLGDMEVDFYGWPSDNSSLTWDNGYPSGGNYWENYSGIDARTGADTDIRNSEIGSDGIGDTPYVLNENNTDNYPLMKPYPCGPHDIGISNIRKVFFQLWKAPSKDSKTVIMLGFTLEFNVFVMNYGIHTEVFNMTVHANTTLIDTILGTTVESMDCVILNFTWNTTGLSKGKYILSAYASPVLNETDISDNIHNETIYISHVGDLTGGTANPWDFIPDGIVDGSDLIVVSRGFGSDPRSPPIWMWHSNCDINNDAVIDGADMIIISRHFGEQDP